MLQVIQTLVGHGPVPSKSISWGKQSSVISAQGVCGGGAWGGEQGGCCLRSSGAASRIHGGGEVHAQNVCTEAQEAGLWRNPTDSRRVINAAPRKAFDLYPQPVGSLWNFSEVETMARCILNRE